MPEMFDQQEQIIKGRDVDVVVEKDMESEFYAARSGIRIHYIATSTDKHDAKEKALYAIWQKMYGLIDAHLLHIFCMAIASPNPNTDLVQAIQDLKELVYYKNFKGEAKAR